MRLLQLFIMFVFSYIACCNQHDFSSNSDGMPFVVKQNAVLARISQAPRIEVISSYGQQFLSEITNDSLVVLDIDDTIIHKNLGEYEIIQNFTHIEEKIRKTNSILHLLTYRPEKYRYKTLDCLKSLGLFNPPEGLIRNDRATFTGGEDKGDALVETIQGYLFQGKMFNKIIFVDDNPKRVRDVMKKIKRLPIGSKVGFIYQGFVNRDTNGKKPNDIGHSDDSKNLSYSMVGPVMTSYWNIEHLSRWEMSSKGQWFSGRANITSCAASLQLIVEALKSYQSKLFNGAPAMIEYDPYSLAKCIESNHEPKSYRVIFHNSEFFDTYVQAILALF